MRGRGCGCVGEGVRVFVDVRGCSWVGVVGVDEGKAENLDSGWVSLVLQYNKPLFCLLFYLPSFHYKAFSQEMLPPPKVLHAETS